MALKVTTKTKDGTDQTLTWAAEVADAVVRYREQSYDAGTGLPKADDYYDPDKLWADGSAEHTTNGASWLEVYTDTKIPVGGATGTGSENRDLWTVTSDNESVTVPAGTFDGRGVPESRLDQQTYWYVRGVGKVKETGGQVEELVSFMLTRDKPLARSGRPHRGGMLVEKGPPPYVRRSTDRRDACRVASGSVQPVLVVRETGRQRSRPGRSVGALRHRREPRAEGRLLRAQRLGRRARGCSCSTAPARGSARFVSTRHERRLGGHRGGAVSERFVHLRRRHR